VGREKTAQEAKMTKTEARALRVKAMLTEADVLAAEVKRLGERFKADRAEHTVCAHCLNTGYVYMGVETEDGEFEEAAYLCRRCSRV
jgi:hypothetical protein